MRLAGIVFFFFNILRYKVIQIVVGKFEYVEKNITEFNLRLVLLCHIIVH